MNQMLAMRVFRCIVEAQGFSAAAERLDTTHSSVSRHLQQLESTLGVRHYYALYPHARNLPAKVRAFVDFMAEYYRPKS